VPYLVEFVADTALPEHTDWAIATTDVGSTYFFIKESRVAPDVLSEAWAAWEERRSRRGLYSIASMMPTASNA
jgi:hypothetical protein